MESDKKERLFLTSALALTLTLGVTFEFVKVPMQTQTVTVKKVPAQVETIQADETLNYEISIPAGYTLTMDENGNLFGYREEIVEETKIVKLGDYLSETLSSTFGIAKKLKTR